MHFCQNKGSWFYSNFSLTLVQLETIVRIRPSFLWKDVRFDVGTAICVIKRKCFFENCIEVWFLHKITVLKRNISICIVEFLLSLRNYFLILLRKAVINQICAFWIEIGAGKSKFTDLHASANPRKSGFGLL